MPKYGITKEIEFDAGHRVLTHEGKCSNLHGHRYKVKVTCTSYDLVRDGEQSAMVMDFGFLKHLMMEKIHNVFDHSLILYLEDPLLFTLGVPEAVIFQYRKELAEAISFYGISKTSLCWKFKDYTSRDVLCEAENEVCIVSFVPTAEELAKHVYLKLNEIIAHKYPIGFGSIPKGVELGRVEVWETPTSTAIYPCVLPYFHPKSI